MSVQRPLSPFMLGSYYRPQLTSVLSILHRITGLILCLGAVALVAWVAALTLALWQSHGQETARELTREEREAAWLERQEDRMEARLRAETEKAWWDQ